MFSTAFLHALKPYFSDLSRNYITIHLPGVQTAGTSSFRTAHTRPCSEPNAGSYFLPAFLIQFMPDCRKRRFSRQVHLRAPPRVN